MSNNDIKAYILENWFDKNGKIKAYYCSDKYLSEHNDIKTYLQNVYNDIPKEFFTFKEVIYRLKHNIIKRPTCPICNQPIKFHNSTTGYYIACSNSCIQKVPSIQNKIKNTTLKRYGVEHVSHSTEIQLKKKQTCLERYGVEHIGKSDKVINKRKQTCLEKYGVTSFTQTQVFKDKSKQTCLNKYGVEYASQDDNIKQRKANTFKNTIKCKYGTDFFFQSDYFKNKSKQTCLNKYGYEYSGNVPMFIEKRKQTCLQKYGSITFLNSEAYKNILCKKYNLPVNNFYHHMQIQSIKDKVINTKRKNHTFNTSKSEQLLLNKLKEYFNSNDIFTQYKSEVYPFNCDFYIKSLNLYIEYQGTWSHGYHPFDALSNEDKNTLSKWLEKSKQSAYYKYSIYIWTKLDPLKRHLAKINKLNYIEIWSEKEIENIYNIIIQIDQTKENRIL